MKHKKIKMTLAAMGLLSATIFFAACDKEDNSLPPIDGYNNSNEVGAANLKAHWTFDNNESKEVISNTAPGASFGGVAYTTGQIGGALNLTAGALVYPPIANLNTADALSSYTVSLWVNVNNTGNTFSTFFALIPGTATDLWASVQMSAETGWFQPAANDTLVLKTNYGSLKPDGSYDLQDNRPDPRGTPPKGVFKGTGRWVHFVARWSATTHLLEVFADGLSVGAYDNRGTTGNMILKPPMIPVVGALPNNDIGFVGVTGARGTWMPLVTAAIDDIRVFNTPLATKDITALYNLGKAGR